MTIKEKAPANAEAVNKVVKQSEDNKRLTQLKTIFSYLQNHVATASMLEAATGVHHKNICRYKSDLEKAGNLWEVGKAKCQRTGHRAWYITTDPAKAPKCACNQLSIFNNEP